MVKYLFNVIIQRFKIDVVYNNMLQVIQKLYKGLLKVYFFCSLLVMCRGMIMIVMVKFVIVREIKNKFCMLCKGLYVRMVWIMKILLIIVIVMVIIMRNVSMQFLLEFIKVVLFVILEVELFFLIMLVFFFVFILQEGGSSQVIN